jgi:hypothetical protein
MAIAFRSVALTTGTAAGATVNEPASAASGDFILAVVLTGSSATSLTRPTGWSNLANGTSQESFFDYDISYIVRGGSAPSLAWTWTNSVSYEIHLLAFTGVDATPIDAQSGVTSAFSGAPDPPAVVAATSPTWAIAISLQASGATTVWTAPTNYTLRSDETHENTIAVASRALAATGSEDPGTFAGAFDTGTNYVAMSITLKEGAGGGGETITIDKWWTQSPPNKPQRAVPVASGIIGIRNT